MLDFIHDDVFHVDYDLIVIPFSTAGTISESFRIGLENLSIPYTLDFTKYSLGEIGIVQIPNLPATKYVAFVCTVDNFSSAYYAIRSIGQNLGEEIRKLKDVREIATPILGTGAGELDPAYSRNIMLNAFYETAPNTVRLTFCTPDKQLFDFFESRPMDIDTPSSQLVIEAELPRILQTDYVERILTDKNFFYELAQEKFREYLNFASNQRDFFEKLESEFKISGITFKEFLSTKEDSKEQFRFLVLCGELIAYIDYHAYRKNIWNKYSDKRVLARSAVRQNYWITNLIKYKKTRNLISLSASIKNALIYLENPSNNLTMLSDKHRENVFAKILARKYEGPESSQQLLNFFRGANLSTSNPKNFGALCSRILYHPYIKPLWNNSASKAYNENIIDEGIEEIDLVHATKLIEECIRTRATRLDLGRCGLKDLLIIPELFDCVHLEELILSNEWGEFENGKWQKKVSNNKGKQNSIFQLPDEIRQLKNLRRLVCGGDWNNQKGLWNRWAIVGISQLLELKNLEYLNLSNNMLKSVRGINKLNRLQVLHLNNNELTSIEPLNDLQNLKEIYLSNNHIKHVLFLQSLKNIETIDLHNNLVQDLRPIENVIEKIGIKNKKWEVGTLNVAKNPLGQPPMQIVNIGKAAVLSTLRDVRLRGRYINKDVKVIMVGNSEAGKSTLVKYFNNEIDINLPHPPTLWMEEKTLKSKYKIDGIGEECVLHIFDFGGHDYYHDTHHLFYSTNTIYVLMWETQTNKLFLRKTLQANEKGIEVQIETQDYPIKYWLESVKHYIKDVEADNFEFEYKRGVTYNSSLLLLQNKVSHASQVSHQNNEFLFKAYPFIFDIANVSIKDPRRNIDQFDVLFQEMLNSLMIIGAILPKFYETIKNDIPNYVGPPVISTEDFLAYCNSLLKTPIDMEQCQILIKYLEQIGILIYSSKTEIGKVYIDKSWILKNIHKVLINLISLKGEFDKNYIINVLGTPANDVENILEIMMDFKMLFKHPYSDTFIAPLYLPLMPERKVNLFLNANAIPYRRFEYSGFIHKGVLLSVFQKYCSLVVFNRATNEADTFYYWKDGLIIKKPSTTEIVMIKFHLGNNDGNAFIDVFNVGGLNNSIGFINEVVEYIADVNKGYELEEMVTLDGIDFISTKILEENAKQGKLVFSEKKSSDLLLSKDEIKYFKLKDYTMFLKANIKKKKVVISYSKKDVADVHTLKRYMQPLVDSDLIEEPWYCTSLLPGDDWELKIKSKFDEADIVFFLVSEYFYNTRYIVEHEIKNSIDRYDNNQSVKIVPIILEFYEWGRKDPYNLQRFSALPYQAKPIRDFHNPKLAWSTITTTVRMMIEKDLDPAKVDLISRDLQEIYERQVKGSLDDNR